MNASLAVRIIRDIYNRVGLQDLRGVLAERKADGSTVTDIDPLIEHIVLEHLTQSLDLSDTAVVREESDSAYKISDVKKKRRLLTIDGIDGTGDFIRHYNESNLNSKWLIAMTAMYEMVDNGKHKPMFAFAFQPHENRLFLATSDESLLILHPLERPVVHRLTAKNITAMPRQGSVDVYLKKDECKFTMDDKVVAQTGPSGFNFASLAASCIRQKLDGSKSINFTTFHYKLWDFGLWPVLHNAGITTIVRHADKKKKVTELDLNWFAADDDSLTLCASNPLILSVDADFDPLVPK